MSSDSIDDRLDEIDRVTSALIADIEDPYQHSPEAHQYIDVCPVIPEEGNTHVGLGDTRRAVTGGIIDEQLWEQALEELLPSDLVGISTAGSSSMSTLSFDVAAAGVVNRPRPSEFWFYSPSADVGGVDVPIDYAPCQVCGEDAPARNRAERRRPRCDEHPLNPPAHHRLNRIQP